MPSPKASPSRLKAARALTGLAISGALACGMNAGSAQAVLNCTFGNTSGCALPEQNLRFKNFSFTPQTGGGAEGADIIQVSKSGSDYILSFTAGGAGSFDTNATLTFDLDALNGYTFKNAAANSTMGPGAQNVFIFTYTIPDLVAPTTFTTSGSFSPLKTFAPNTSSTSVTISWGAGVQFAQNTSLYLQLTDPAPVPGPLPLFGAATAFGFSRRLRQRIKARA